MAPKAAAVARDGVDFHSWRCTEPRAHHTTRVAAPWVLRAFFTRSKGLKKKQVTTVGDARWAAHGFPESWPTQAEAEKHAEPWKRMMWGLHPVTGAPLLQKKAASSSSSPPPPSPSRTPAGATSRVLRPTTAAATPGTLCELANYTRPDNLKRLNTGKVYTGVSREAPLSRAEVAKQRFSHKSDKVAAVIYEKNKRT